MVAVAKDDSVLKLVSDDIVDVSALAAFNFIVVSLFEEFGCLFVPI